MNKLEVACPSLKEDCSWPSMLGAQKQTENKQASASEEDEAESIEDLGFSLQLSFLSPDQFCLSLPSSTEPSPKYHLPSDGGAG